MNADKIRNKDTKAFGTQMNAEYADKTTVESSREYVESEGGSASHSFLKIMCGFFICVHLRNLRPECLVALNFKL